MIHFNFWPFNNFNGYVHSDLLHSDGMCAVCSVYPSWRKNISTLAGSSLRNYKCAFEFTKCACLKQQQYHAAHIDRTFGCRVYGWYCTAVREIHITSVIELRFVFIRPNEHKIHVSITMGSFANIHTSKTRMKPTELGNSW